MKIFIFFFVFFISGSILSGNYNERRDEIIKIINQEIKEVSKISRQYRHRKPHLLLRIGELFLEKGRLLKDREQEKFQSISPKKRARMNRARFFSESRRYFLKAQKTCLSIIKKFKNFNKKEEVYYILAFNSREFSRERESERYFKLALKNSKGNSDIYKKSSLALAETYYNKKKYGKAIKHYKLGMKGKKDKWWTRNSYNMAWSYYRKKSYLKALRLMEKIYTVSEDSRHIDMRKEIKLNIGAFYFYANKIEEGVEFFSRLDKDSMKYLVSLSRTLLENGSWKDAEKILLRAMKLSDNEDEIIKIKFSLLDLFGKKSAYLKHLKLSKELFKVAQEDDLNDEEGKVLIFQLKRVGGILQKRVVKKRKNSKKKSTRKNASFVAEYFSMIAYLDRKNRGKYLYLKGETYYAALMMEEAHQSYKDTLRYETKNRNKKSAKLAIEGMLASLSSPFFEGKRKEKYLLPSYEIYLSIDKKSNRSDKIYQRIFNKYLANQDMVNTEKTLDRYKNQFSKNHLTQEAMLGKIMDFYKRKNDRKNFRRLVRKIQRGEYYIGNKYKKRLGEVLNSMRFGGVEKLSKSGKKKKALEGYLSIYHDSSSALNSKKNAAHNIAVLYFELGYAKNTYLWSNRSIDLMKPQELSKFSATYLAISSELFNMQRFEKSVDLSEKIYRKICYTKVEEKISFYKNTYIIYLTLDQFSKSKEIVLTGKQCGISMSDQEYAYGKILKVLIEKKDWKAFEKEFGHVKKFSSLGPKLIIPTARLAGVYREFSDEGRAADLEKKIERFYLEARRKKKKIGTDALWEIARIRLRKMENFVKKFNEIHLVFPQKKFDVLLGQKIQLLEKISSQAENIFKIKSGKGILRANRLIIESYQKIVKEIRNVKIKGKKKDYVNSFRKAMKNIENSLLKKSLSYLNQSRKLIASGKVLSQDNYWFISKNRLPIDIEYHFSENAILMDRSGR